MASRNKSALALRVQAEQIADHYTARENTIGAPSLLGDPDTVQQLLAAVADGNYRETACAIAGISKVTFYAWLKRAEAGDIAAQAFVNALEKAEAAAELEMVNCVRGAAKAGPQFWAAGMTYLERKSPEKWGRRQDESTAPKVIVQIGIRDSDVTITTQSSAGTERDKT